MRQSSLYLLVARLKLCGRHEFRQSLLRLVEF
jgi:hypothetical protein